MPSVALTLTRHVDNVPAGARLACRRWELPAASELEQSAAARESETSCAHTPPRHQPNVAAICET